MQTIIFFKICTFSIPISLFCLLVLEWKWIIILVVSVIIPQLLFSKGHFLSGIKIMMPIIPLVFCILSFFAPGFLLLYSKVLTTVLVILSICIFLKAESALITRNIFLLQTTVIITLFSVLWLFIFFVNDNFILLMEGLIISAFCMIGIRRSWVRFFSTRKSALTTDEITRLESDHGGGVERIYSTFRPVRTISILVLILIVWITLVIYGNIFWGMVFFELLMVFFACMKISDVRFFLVFSDGTGALVAGMLVTLLGKEDFCYFSKQKAIHFKINGFPLFRYPNLHELLQKNGKSG
jgi:hypothetical protein